ncbi:hypothetical protein DL93DRAFT_1365953 [Clavulina sp. PMI_390]|nr:hypothetical protein DL93DRAFT_1365953 [Clavulina sp. PMI_390]
MLAFTFASPLLTYPLYVSRLVPSPNVSATAPKPRRIPWPIHTIAAALLSAALLTPYLLIPISSAQPNPILRSVALASGIPPIWILAVVPRLPNPSSTSPYYARGTYKYALWTFLTLIAVLVPTESSFTRGLRRIVILSVIFTTYLLPALLHIALHLLRAPLAILIGASSTLPGESADPEHQRLEVDPQLPNSGNAPLPSDAEALLRRKERSLQRRRFGRRIAWDALVLVVLLPVGGWLTIWSFGSVFGIW